MVVVDGGGRGRGGRGGLVVVVVLKVKVNFKRREGGDDRPRRSFDDKPRGERPAFW